MMSKRIDDNAYMMLLGEILFLYHTFENDAPKSIVCINCDTVVPYETGANVDCPCGDVSRILLWRRGVYEG